jgi:hypothetical protein
VTRTSAALDWLLDSDPAIRWQVLRDLLDAPEAEWRAERARVATEGWGARLLSLQDPDGSWAGGAFVPNDFSWEEWERVGQPWTPTSHVLTELREYGLDPASEAARRAVRLVGENVRWYEDEGGLFWGGETEECINGRTVADGCYFGVDMTLLVERLLGERLPDGGWNCERARGSTRSSFASTINVLDGLYEYERATGGTAESRAARRSGEEYLLARGLFRRLSTGEVADAEFLSFVHPHRWRYDVLRALDYLRAAAELGDGVPDPRLADAVDVVRRKQTPQTPDGRWLLDRKPGVVRGRRWRRRAVALADPPRPARTPLVGWRLVRLTGPPAAAPCVLFAALCSLCPHKVRKRTQGEGPKGATAAGIASARDVRRTCASRRRPRRTGASRPGDHQGLGRRDGQQRVPAALPAHR